MTSNIGRGQRRRTFDFDQEDSLLPIKRKATCSLDTVVASHAQKLELDISCSVSAADLHNGGMSSQPSRSATPPETLIFSDASCSPSTPSENNVGSTDMMIIEDPGPSNRASRQSVGATRQVERMRDGTLESMPHAHHASWAHLPANSHSNQSLNKVPSGSSSHYPTIDLTGDSFSHLEVCEFTRALKRSRLHETDSIKLIATRRGAVSNPAAQAPSTNNTRCPHSGLELKEVFLQDIARPPSVPLKHSRQRRFQPALSSVRRRSWTKKLKPRANSLPVELPSFTTTQRSSQQSSSTMTPSTPPTPTHTLPPLGPETTSGAVRNGKNQEVQDTAMDMLPTDSGVGTSSTPSSAPTSDDDEARPLLAARARHGHVRCHHHHQIRGHRHHRLHDQQLETIDTTTMSSAFPDTTTTHSTLIGRPFPSTMNLQLASLSSYPASSSSSSSHTPSPASPSLIPSPPVVPPTYPLITRDTLKELELDVTLRSPQLRHDILFDPGLQFRPTTGRRKREASDRYWEAVAREMQWGCTCTCFDKEQKIHPCICGKVPPGATPASLSSDSPVHTAWRGYVLGTPSRVLPLLETLKEVLHLVVHPASMTAVASNVSAASTSGLPSAPPASSSSDAPQFPTLPQSSRPVPNSDPLLAPFDPALIQQELAHGVFDYESVFKWVGHMMKMHCAPMRDGMVENMVRLATELDETDPNPERRPVKALKMCFDILEVMKLDIANHQLQSLRPYLLDTSADFEMKTFQERFEKRVTGLEITRRWISRAYTSQTQTPSLPVRSDRSKTISVALCSAMVDLVFQPPTPPNMPDPTGPSQQNDSQVATPVPDRHSRSYGSRPRTCEVGFPETLYLDHARLVSYINDASDLLGLYMLIMLFRQLTNAGGSGTGAKPAALEDWEIDRIKREVWEVGPSRLGLCFDVGPGAADPKSKWEKGMSDVALQIAKRADEARERMANGSSKSSSEPMPAAENSTEYVPSPQMLTLIEKWKAANYRKDSPLQKLLQRRLQAAVLDVVKEQVLTASSVSNIVDASSGSKSPSARVYSAMPMRRINRHPLTSGSMTGPSTTAANVLKKHPGSGLEPLMPEILHLGDRISRLVVFHSRVYKRLYEVDGFIDAAL